MSLKFICEKKTATLRHHKSTVNVGQLKPICRDGQVPKSGEIFRENIFSNHQDVITFDMGFDTMVGNSATLQMTMMQFSQQWEISLVWWVTMIMSQNVHNDSAKPGAMTMSL